MQSVIIVQGSSSAYLYVQECWVRGIEPVVVNPPEYNPDRAYFNKRTEGRVKTLDIKTEDDYPKILGEVRKLDPICVVAGNSGGVVIADRMARDLGFRCNDPETTWRRDTKAGMHQSLKEAGIRYIRTAFVRTDDDIDRFWDECNLKTAMLKFNNGAGSVGNKICHSAEEAKDYLARMRKTGNIFGAQDDAVIQEFINGEEYVVDTVSCEGRHIVTDIWKYKKVKTANGDVIYDETQLIVDPTPGMMELVRYAYKALDATGIRYGPCHGEFMIDEKGPVLIETNARPIGFSMDAEYLDECLGHHVADIALDAYLDPLVFNARRTKLYRPRAYAAIKNIFSLEERDANIYPLKKVLAGLKSFRVCSTEIEDKTVHLKKTVDLESCVTTVKLCHSDLNVLTREMRFLDTIEMKYSDLMFTRNKTLPRREIETDLKLIIDHCYSEWSTVVVTEKERYVTRFGMKTEVRKDAKCDLLIYADASAGTIAERFQSIMEWIRMLNDSGMVIVTKEVYEDMPYGSAAMEILLSICGCKVEISHADFENVITGSKYT